MISEALMCLRRLDKEEIAQLNFDDLTVAEIQLMIDCCAIDKEDVVNYYNNEWWHDKME